MSEPQWDLVSVDTVWAKVVAALRAAGASDASATSTAKALVAAERDGQAGHGLSRVSSYVAQLRTGKVDGQAQPTVQRVRPAVIAVDAKHGFAYPALDLAISELIDCAASQGIALATVRRSHHFGQAGAHVERLGSAGLVGLAFANSPKAIAFWGGSAPMLGTNPIAFACPRSDGEAPLVIDLALSVTARGKIMAAAKRGERIPSGWALDADGQPTTEPGAALEGSMIPIGEAKGAALALMVELLAVALSGANFGWEASSLFTGEGDAPGLGHCLIAIDPGPASANTFAERLQTLLLALAETDGAREPGSRRLQAREHARTQGLRVASKVWQEVLALAGA